MIQTVFKAQTIFLLNDEPDWGNPVESQFTLIRDTQSSLTRREGRRPFSSTLLTNFSYTSSVRRAALLQLLGSLRALNTQPVIVPFYAAITTWAERATTPLNGGLRIVWKADWSQYEIYASTDAEPGWPSVSDFFAPALMGFLKFETSPAARRDVSNFRVNFVESSIADYALQPTGLDLIAGPKPAGYAVAPSILPFIPDREGIEEATSVQIKRDQIGFDREQDVTFYPHAAERSAKYNFTLRDPADAAGMMQFFLNVAGPGASFWSASSFQCLSLTNDAAPDDVTLQVENTAAIAIGDAIYIFVGPTPYARTITNIVGNVVTIDAALGVEAPADCVAIFPLVLSRLEKASLKLTWLKPGVATAEMQWGEVPAELLVPADETLGVTIGRMPTRIVLFQFTRDLGNGTVLNWYFRGGESDVAYNGQNWLHSPFACGDITQTLNLEDDNVTITSYASTFFFPGNPLIDDLTKAAEAPLTVKIIFADYDGVNVTNAQTVFTGDCGAPSRVGNTVKMKCKMGSALFDSKLPIFIRGPMCSHLRGCNPDGTHLISVGCTGPDNIMLKANWKFTAVVAAPLSAAWPFALNLNTLAGVGARAIASLAANAVFANWFANGFIEWGVGEAIQRRMIVGSTVPVAGVLALNLHRFFKGVPNIGDAVTLYPGCDGLFATCQAYDAATNPTGKFNNSTDGTPATSNFGGDPFTPIANPSLVSLTQIGAQGTKK